MSCFESCSGLLNFFRTDVSPPAWEVILRRKDARGADLWCRELRAPSHLQEALREAAKNGDANAVSSKRKRLALNEAVKLKASSLVKSLIEADANPQLTDGEGETAVQCAERLKLGTTMMELLEHDSCKKQTKEFHQGLSLIQKISLFTKIHPSEYPRLAAAFSTRHCVPGEVIIQAGQSLSEMFLIADGVAQVSGDKVSELGKGSHFGENALLADGEDEICSEQIVAKTSVTLKVLTRSKFQALGLKSWHKRKAVRSVDSDPTWVNASLKQKTSQEMELIERALTANTKLGPLVKGLSHDDLQQIATNAWRMEVDEGQQVVQQGSIKADNFYIVSEGHLEVFKDGEKVLDLESESSFGELALLYRAPRAATDLRKLMQAPLKKKLEGFAILLQRVDILKHLTNEEKVKLANVLVEMTFYRGETIIQQGEEGDTFYILYDGQVSVVVDGQEVTHLEGNAVSSTANFFGERALLTDEPRAATIIATTPKVRVLALDREHFLSVVHPDELGGGMSPKAMVKYELRALKQIGLIGCGGFGTVTLQRCTLTDKIFALKTLSKGFMVQRGQQQSVLNEKNVLRMTQSPFIIRLAATFNEPQRLHFLLEPALGGDLFTVYQKNEFHGSVVHAQFYVACVVRAFQHLHQRHIIYRDMKPENLLLDSKGYCKVADFGLAKFVIGYAYTTCGTPEYFAPEMVLHMGHSTGVDWWSLGILAYELVVGDSPFAASEPMQVFRLIKQGIQAVVFPKSPPGAWAEFVQALCQEEPSERLPMRRGGVHNVEAHDFYSGFDWAALDSRTMIAPFVPVLKRQDSLANFDVGDVRRPPTIRYEDTGTGWDDDFEDRRGPKNF